MAALLLAFLFAGGIITLPILHTELAKKYEVRERDIKRLRVRFSPPFAVWDGD